VSNHIEGKVIIVTGAASGFGRLVCQKAARLGARLACADIDGSGLEEVVAQITSTGGNAFACVTDVTDLKQVQALAEKTLSAHQAIDVMINNAGVMPLAFFSDHAEAADHWSRCIDINFKGVLHGCISVYDQMIRQGKGHIVNLSSIYGNYPVAGAGVYGATKSAVNFLSESLRIEARGKIKVTTVKPTGVPATNLGSGVVNREAVVGILGHNARPYFEQLQALTNGEGDPEQANPDSTAYLALEPEYIADAIIATIDQPWGVATSDITVRATGDGYIL